MTVVVTGTAGHAGANLVRALLAKSRPTRALVHVDHKAVEGLDVEVIEGDIRDPVQAAEAYCREGADELVFLDIFATVQNRKTRLEWVKRVCDVVTVPFAVGGGIGNIEDMKALLDIGTSSLA